MDWELWTMFWLLGALVGFGISTVATIFKTNKRYKIRSEALRKISHYQWGTGVNDAMVITRIALKGLNGE